MVDESGIAFSCAAAVTAAMTALSFTVCERLGYMILPFRKDP